MHPDNTFKYKDNNYYSYLAQKYPNLYSVCKKQNIKDKNNLKIDWEHPSATYELTKATLLDEFNLKWELPKWNEPECEKQSTPSPKNLVPPVPRSINYLCWVKDLVVYSHAHQVISFDLLSTKMPQINGLDVGTGASCIFSLLGSVVSPQWNFVATDIVASSLQHAQKLSLMNSLEGRIGFQLVENAQYVSPVLNDIKKPHISFSICNPPFFSSYDGDSERKSKLAKFEGKEHEKAGLGELEFFKCMFYDSRPFELIWFTCMFGRKASLLSAFEIVDSSVETYATALVQGNTTRWCIAWRFGSVFKSKLKQIFKNEHSFSFNYSELTTLEVWNRAMEFFRHGQSVITFSDDTVIRLPCAKLEDMPHISSSTSARCFVIRKDKEFYFYMLILNGAVTLTPLLEENEELHNLCVQLEQAVLRTNRKWRRQKKVGEKSDKNM